MKDFQMGMERKKEEWRKKMEEMKREDQVGVEWTEWNLSRRSQEQQATWRGQVDKA